MKGLEETFSLPSKSPIFWGCAVSSKTASLEQELQETVHLVEKYQSLSEILRDELDLSKRRDEWNAKYPGEQEHKKASAVGSSRRRSSIRKPRSQLIEEIILERGRPVYVGDIVEKLLERGVTFTGKTPPRGQVTSAISKSKRFRNMGGNNWWLGSVSLPDEQPDRVSVPVSEEGNRLLPEEGINLPDFRSD